MLAYYLPLLPYIAWLGAMISWLTVVIEGVIAAPLWAFAHMDTDGEGMGQKAQHGYLFLLQVLLRPVLMVVGFVFSMMVMEVIGKFFYMTYPIALGDANTIGSWYDIIGLVVAVAVFFTTSVMIVNLSTNLIHFIRASCKTLRQAKRNGCVDAAKVVFFVVFIDPNRFGSLFVAVGLSPPDTPIFGVYFYRISVFLYDYVSKRNS